MSKRGFIPYENLLSEKCLLVRNKASVHISEESIKFLEKNNISYILIPSGMTPECQPLDISVNKVLKGHIKYKFKLNRINLDKINGKMKLKTARLNLIENLNSSWADDNLITKDIIMHGFNNSGIINNYYLNYEEEKLNKNYLYDLFEYSNLDILNDLGADLNLNSN